MTELEKEFGFDLSKGNWSKCCNNKACTHGYSKNMNEPRFKNVSNTADLGFSGADKKSSLEATDFDMDLDMMMESVNDEWT